MTRYHLPIGLAVLAAALGACARETPVAEVKGDCAEAYQGQVCTWARTQGTAVVSVGASVPVSAIENAPKEGEMTWPPTPIAVLRLPESVQQRTGLTHLTMYWEPMGHPPGPYLTPHFDFHFYTIPPEERSAIDCADLSKPPALAAAYSLPDLTLPPPMAKMAGVSTLAGLCVPQMGMHSLLTAELESANVFRGSLVIGYYHGKPIFVEPMLSRALLLERRSFDLPIPDIPGMARAYPHTFHAEYDAQSQAYQFVFSDFAPGT